MSAARRTPIIADKAQGVRIDLWAGIAMLALGLVFLLYQWVRPAEAPSASSDDDADGPRGGPTGVQR
jgi:hypothetical protein